MIHWSPYKGVIVTLRISYDKYETMKKAPYLTKMVPQKLIRMSVLILESFLGKFLEFLFLKVIFIFNTIVLIMKIEVAFPPFFSVSSVLSGVSVFPNYMVLYSSRYMADEAKWEQDRVDRKSRNDERYVKQSELVVFLLIIII